MHRLLLHRARTRWAALLVAVLSLSGLGLLTAGPASATHYRATQITWLRTGAKTADFELTASWRCTYFFNPCNVSPGATFTSDSLNYGDGTGDTPIFTVLTVDPVNDVLTAESSISHTYATTGPFTAYIDTCCRLSAPLHINNPDGSIRVETIVDLARTSASPESAISPIVDCAINSVCQFSIPAIDPDGQGLRFRFSTLAESYLTQPGPPFATNAATIDPTTGVYRWDTTGATLNPGGDSFYSTQVTIENVVGGAVVSKTPVDFFIRLGSGSANRQPQFVSPTPADGTTYTIALGDSVSFSTKASDPDAGNIVTPGMIGKPADATYTTTPGNPATGSFSWTPTATGSTILVLTATDQFGLGATQRSITINVTATSAATLSIADTKKLEGTGVGKTAVFKVTLSAVQTSAVTVSYATSDGTATSGLDYVAKSGTLTIPAGATSGTIPVKLVGDSLVESNETFKVTLSNPSAPVTLSRAVATGTIRDDDSGPA